MCVDCIDGNEMSGVVPAKVPGEWQSDTRFWTVLRGRPWSKAENILLLEARALCTAVQIGCSHAGAKGVRLLCLVDNMVLCLSAGRSRAQKIQIAAYFENHCRFDACLWCFVECAVGAQRVQRKLRTSKGRRDPG